MDDLEARVRCLELAATMLRPSGIPTGQSVVEIATVMYSFVNAPPAAPETEPQANTDKQRTKRPGKPDPFS